MSQPITTPPDFNSSPLYLLAVLFSARRSRDRLLERMTRQRLDALGVQITFGDESPADAAGSLSEETAHAR